MPEKGKYNHRAARIAEARKRNTLLRNERVKARFNELYNLKRKRYDDCISELATEFNLATNTILCILRK